MRSHISISFLMGAILAAAIGSGTALTQEAPTSDKEYTIPEELAPVWKWKNGFTAGQAQQYIKSYNAKSFVVADDIGTYAYLNLSEVLPVSKVFRKGDVADLEVDIDDAIGKFTVDGPLGNLTLEEVLNDAQAIVKKLFGAQ